MNSNPPPSGGTAASISERALQAIRDLKAEVRRLEDRDHAPVAIVGMGCRFPGAGGLDGFWDLLVSGTDPMGPPPDGRWNIDAFYSPDPAAPGKTVAREGGYLRDLDRFDAAFFGISPREAIYIDPRQRLILETGWEALEDAGIPPLSLARTRTGVFVGVLTNDYHHLITSDPTWISAATGTGTANAIVANRLSYFLDLRGPSIALDTACASSLVAIHLALTSLRAGESTLALAGGVTLNLLPSPDISFSRMGALAPYARCATFDADAAGMIRSDGAGMIVLKLLEQAIADGDRIHAVIRGSAVNHDGRSNGIASPNGRAQVALLEEAYERTGISPGMVQYIEAHGTGTTVGDAIEIQALTEVLGRDRPAGRPVVFGSVKSNIGHTESAAGVAGVIKTALAMSRGTIPPNLHIRKLNPALAAAPFPIEVRQEPGAFPVPGEPVIAGLSGFSFGGTNAHVVMEQAPAPAAAAEHSPGDDGRVHVLPLSAASPEALTALARQTADLLAGEAAPRLEDIAYTACLRRSHLDHRLAVAGRTHAELRARLLAAIGEGDPGDDADVEATTAGKALDPADIRVAFVFSGQGSEWIGMGRDLSDGEPAFRAALEALEPHFRRHAGWSLLEAVADPQDRPERHAIDHVQPMIFAIQTALAALWRSWGIEPAEVLGQSMGEVAAAHASGALDADAAVRVIVARSRLLKTRSGAGGTAVVGLGEDETRAALAGFAGRLDIAGMTSFGSTVIAGDAAALAELFETLERDGVFCRLLETIEVPAHSPAMDELVPKLVAELAGLAPGPAEIPFISTVTAAEVAGDSLDAGYWGANLRKPFRVAEAVSALAAKGTSVFVEISPHPVVAGALRQCLDGPGVNAVVTRSMSRHLDGATAMASALGALHVAGVPVDWTRFVVPGARLAKLPTYPWQREHHWVDALGVPALYHGDGGEADAHPLLGRHLALARDGSHVFVRDIDRNALSWPADHKVGETPVLPAAAWLEMAAAAAREAFGWETVTVRDAAFERMLLLPAEGRRTVQTTLVPAGSGEVRITFHSRPADSPAESWTLHASAEASRSEAPIDRQAFAAADAAEAEIEVGPFYERLSRRGLGYGPAFRGIRRLAAGAHTASAEIAAPVDADGYILHPGALDAAFQTVAAILPDDGEERVYLPSRVGAIRVFGAARRDGFVSRARIASAPVAGSETLTADIVLTDRSGTAFALVEALVLTRLDEIASTATGMETGAYRLAWRPKARAAAPDRSTARQWIIADDSRGTGAVLAEALAARGHVVARVADGERRSEELVRRLRASPEAGLIYFAEDRSASADRPGDTVRARCGAVLDATRAMIGRRAPLWLVTRGAQAVGEGERPAIVEAPLWGFGRILAIEHPELMGGLVDLDPAGGADEADVLLGEILNPDEDRQIAVRKGMRHVARLEPQPREDAALPTSFRADATYLITGGLSGLGLATARWMASSGAQHFLILGRTQLPARADWASLVPGTAEAERIAAIRDLEAAGKSVHVSSLDVADDAAVSALIERWRAEVRPPIRGIVHAAGAIDDRLIGSMEPSDFASVMRPKVDGTWALDRASSGLELDFFVIYSSASSILGQIGQANYAAANAFEDAVAFARHAEGRPATVVNWGPWGEVGLYARLALKERADIAGVESILPDEGMTALGKALASGVTQAIVVKADWASVAPSPLTSELAAVAVPVEADAVVGETVLDLLLMADAERRRVIGDAVVEMVAAVLKLDPERVDRRRPVTALGMDSIMAVELRNRIRGRYGVTLTMVELFTGAVDQIAERVEAALVADESLANLLAEVEGLPADAVAAMLTGEREVA